MRISGYPDSRMDGWMDGFMVGWLVGWLIGWLAGWLNMYRGYLVRQADRQTECEPREVTTTNSERASESVSHTPCDLFRVSLPFCSLSFFLLPCPPTFFIDHTPFHSSNSSTHTHPTHHHHPHRPHTLHSSTLSLPPSLTYYYNLSSFLGVSSFIHSS